MSTFSGGSHGRNTGRLVDMAMSLLTIVIPCYNRHDLVARCIRSIGDTAWKDIFVIVVDDGSSPPLNQNEVGISHGRGRVVRLDKNYGRAKALRTGILSVNSQFVMIMDSDDEFEAGAVPTIVDKLRSLTGDHVGLVFPCSDFESGKLLSRLPDGISATLLALRADYRIKGDLKEVVRTEAVKANLYPDPFPERRVPTSYIWAGVSNVGPVRTIAKSVVRHRYLPDGMTRSISRLKRDNPYWLSRTYYRIATADPDAYRSVAFRLINAAKALAVHQRGLGSEEVESLKAVLGRAGSQLATIMGMLIWLLSEARSWVLARLR